MTDESYTDYTVQSINDRVVIPPIRGRIKVVWEAVMSRLMQQRKDLMKNGIYEAAVKILVKYGFEAMTMDRVAEEAGVAKGSLYNYFPNKLELLRFVHAKTVEPMHLRATEIVAANQPAADKLEAIFRMWSEHVGKHRGLFHFLFNEYAVQVLLKHEGETKQQDAIEKLAAVIEQGINEGVFRPVAARQYATLIFGAVREMCERLLASEEVFPVEEVVTVAMDFSLHGVARQGN